MTFLDRDAKYIRAARHCVLLALLVAFDAFVPGCSTSESHPSLQDDGDLEIRVELSDFFGEQKDYTNVTVRNDSDSVVFYKAARKGDVPAEFHVHKLASGKWDKVRNHPRDEGKWVELAPRKSVSFRTDVRSLLINFERIKVGVVCYKDTEARGKVYWSDEKQFTGDRVEFIDTGSKARREIVD